MDAETDARHLAQLLFASSGRPTPAVVPADQRPHEYRRLLTACQASKHPAIVLHDHPDPDAIGAGLALAFLLERELQLQPAIVYGGVIARAENRAMVDELKIPLVPAAHYDLAHADAIALIDCQPKGGNHILPPNVLPTAVLDHHAILAPLDGLAFADIRPALGATCTILTEYLDEAQSPIDERLATALFYGIKTDTQDLGRQATSADALAYLQLFILADKRALAEIQNPRLPRNYYQALHDALERALTFDDIAIANLGPLVGPESTGETADLLVRLEGIRWSLCTGTFGDRLLFSVRTNSPTGDAGAIAAKLTSLGGHAGGHWRLAGGAIPLANGSLGDPSQLEQRCSELFLHVIGSSSGARDLLVRDAHH